MGRARDVRGIGQERRIPVVSVSVIFIKDAWGARQKRVIGSGDK